MYFDDSLKLCQCGMLQIHFSSGLGFSLWSPPCFVLVLPLSTCMIVLWVASDNPAWRLVFPFSLWISWLPSLQEFLFGRRWKYLTEGDGEWGISYFGWSLPVGWLKPQTSFLILSFFAWFVWLLFEFSGLKINPDALVHLSFTCFFFLMFISYYISYFSSA